MNSFISERKILSQRHDVGSRNPKLLPKVTLPSRTVPLAPVKQREFLRPHPQNAFRERLFRLPEWTRPNCLPASAGQERELVVYILYSRHGSLQSSHTDVGNSFLVCEIGEAFRIRSVLREDEEGALLNEDAIIRLHQRFLPWRSWNFAHFGRIPSGSSPSSFQPQWQTMTRTTTEGSKELSGTSRSSLWPHKRNPLQVASDWF